MSNKAKSREQNQKPFSNLFPHKHTDTHKQISAQAHRIETKEEYVPYLIGGGFPRWQSGKESTSQCRRHRRHGFYPWVWKRSGRRKWQPILVIVAWKIPWTEKLGRLESVGSEGIHRSIFSITRLHKSKNPQIRVEGIPPTITSSSECCVCPLKQSS